METRVLLFAGLRERLGQREVMLPLPANATVADVRAGLAAAYPAVAPLLANAAVAINEEYATADARVAPGDTVALIPPVSGG